jgi:bacterioferritin-associated ferredoxin
MRDLCEGVEEHRSRGQAGYEATSFAEVKKLLGVEEFLKLRETL